MDLDQVRDLINVSPFHYHLVLCCLDNPPHADHGLAEPLEPLVELVVAIEADPQGRAADQGKEGDATPKRSGLAILDVFFLKILDSIDILP